MTWYNRRSIRLKGYDYSQNGLYFVTICTKNRENIFGDIVGAHHDAPLRMGLNENGKIVESVWKLLLKRFPIILDEFQIMPNHVHFIIQIDYSMGRENRAPTLGQINYTVGAGSSRPGSSRPDVFPKIWQRNYYEHIIRDESEYQKICYYIENNPQNWETDENKM